MINPHGGYPIASESQAPGHIHTSNTKWTQQGVFIFVIDFCSIMQHKSMCLHAAVY